MGLFFATLMPDVIAILLVLATGLYFYFQRAHKYWERRKVPFLQPTIPLGNSRNLINKASAIGTDSKIYYDSLKKAGHKFGGIYTIVRPVLVLVDPDYIQDIMQKDFHHFTDRGFYFNEKDDPLSAHLFAVGGQRWKNLRVKFTPTFTSGKMKTMFHSIVDCSQHMLDALDTNAAQKEDIDILEVLASFTTDVIGSCAFGINCNSFKNPNAEFRQMGRRIFKRDGLMHMLRYLCVFNLPSLAVKLGLKTTEDEVTNFFTSVVESTVKMREEKDIKRNDFLQILIDLKRQTSSTDNPLTMQEIAAQVFLFFIAGFDTSSTTMNFTLYELARNPEIQEKVRSEVNRVLSNNNEQLTYENINEMKYLTQVLNETMRMYPPVPSLTRTCVQDYKLRDTDIVIEKGTSVLISSYGLHTDPEYFPNPGKYDPDRFTPENIKERHPFVHLPFGDGPRNCIGLRFGLMQSKIGIASIVRRYNLKISPKTKMPLELNSKVFLLKSTETLYLTAERIPN